MDNMVSSDSMALRAEAMSSPVATSHLVNSFGGKTFFQKWSLTNYNMGDLLVVGLQG